MLTFRVCNRKNFCIDCDNKECLHAGDAASDCPAWTCEHPEYSVRDDCGNCPLLKEIYCAKGDKG